MSKIDVVIPTFGRNAASVNRVIDSILMDQNSSVYLGNIIVVDQNNPSLDLGFEDILKCSYDSSFKINSTENQKIVHLVDVQPTLPGARNIGARVSVNEFIHFYDDDVEVLPGSLASTVGLLNREGVDFVGGREVIPEENNDKSLLDLTKDKIRNLFLKENEVASISSNGFFFCDFSKTIETPVGVDTVRGCNFAVSRKFFEVVDGFDINFVGNSIREESDFILRGRSKGMKGVYSSLSSVIHYRQFGGCNNLKKNYQSLRNTLENEKYFQIKHFSGSNGFVFLLRMAPYALKFFISTKGMSVLLVLKYASLFTFMSRR